MKVVLSIDPIKYPLTGIGRYTYELAKGLQSANLDGLQFLSSNRLTASIPQPDDSCPMAKLPAWKSYAQKSTLAVALYRVISPNLKGRALKGLQDHIYHGPNYYLPPFAGRSVVTIHDLSNYLWPQSHPPERVRYMSKEIELSLSRASALITDTEYTRREVAKYFAWPLDRVYAINLASSAEFKPRSDFELRKVLTNYSLEPNGYTLFAGTVEPRKNIGVLLDAYSQLPVSVRKRWPLVIAGYRGWNSEDLHDRFEIGEKQGWLRYLGFVPHDHLPLLMAGARLFAYPSLYEGFGLPVLEAMACGVPVVCSNASTLPEIAGDAAAFHDACDVDGLSVLLNKGLEDECWREAARESSLKQALKFSWDRCIAQTLAVYKEVSSI